MKKSVSTLAIALMLLAAPLTAGADAPPFIPLQGVLTDAEGAAVEGSVDMVLSIYDVQAGGVALWHETQSVLVEDGLFTAYLGDITELDLSLFRDNDELWLGVKVGDDDEMDRVYLGSNPFAGYAEYCGNVPDHAHAYGDLTGTLPDTALPDGVVVGEQSCEGTDKVTGIDTSGVLVCATDEGNEYLAGDGLTLTGSTFSVDPTAVQSRVINTCGTESSIRVINEDGSVVCEADDDTTYDGGDFALSSQACEGTDKVTGVNGSGGLLCAGDQDTTYDGTDFAISSQTCTGTDKVTGVNGSGGLLCGTDQTSYGDITAVYAGTGLTGGGIFNDVTLSLDTSYTDGRYVNEGQANSITSAMITDGQVGSADINSSQVQRRVGGTCSAGNAMGSVGSDGSVTCLPTARAAYNAGSGFLTTSGSWTTVTSVAFDTPSAGTVLVMAGGASGYWDGANEFRVGVNVDSTTPNYESVRGVSIYNAGANDIPVEVSRMFSVSAGSHTAYFVIARQNGSGQSWLWRYSINVVFIPATM